MRQKIQTAILICAVGACVSYFTPAYANEETDRAKLDELKKNIAELKKELEKTKSSRDDLMKTLEDTEKDIGDLRKKADDIQDQLEDGQARLRNLGEERSALNLKKKSQQSYVSQHIKSAWRLGQQGNVRLLLNQQEPATVARNLKFYDYVIQARAEKISAYADTINRLNAIEPEMAYETQKLKQNHSTLQKRQEELQASQSQRKLILSRLLKSIESKDEQLTSLRSDRKRLERVLNNVKRFLDDADLVNNSENFASLRGKLPWPTKGTVLRNFGTSRVSNRLKWEGMLIGATSGNPVVAVHHGRVVFSDYLRGHGLLIIVDHGSDYMTLYAHNEVLYKELGEWVNSGETIATVGNSGGRQDSALYFELRHKGQPTNPRKWFKAA